MNLLSVPFCAAFVLFATCASSFGQQFYGIAFNRNLYRYDAGAGKVDLLQNLAVAAPNSMTALNGTLYVGYATRVVEVAAPSWTPQTVFTFFPPGHDSIRSIAAHPVSGDIYFSTVDDGIADPVPILWQWSRQSGMISLVGTMHPLKLLQAMEFDRTGTLYGWESSFGTLTGRGLVRLNLNNGGVVDVSPGSSAPGYGSTTYSIQSLAFDSNGTCYLASQQAIYRLNNGSDSLSWVGNYSAAISSDFRGIAVVPTAFGAWQNAAFPATAGYPQVAPAIDYDGDGLQNFVEYAMGTDPAVPNGPPSPELIAEGDATYLGIRWSRPAGRSDVRVSGEICEDLTCPQWRSGAFDTVTEILPGQDGTETVVIRDVTPIGTGTPRRFLRPRFVR